MTTRIETFNYRTFVWREFRKLAPGEHTTFSQTLENGERELFLVQCDENNIASRISVSKNPNDTRISKWQKFVPMSANFEEVDTISQGQVREMDLKREFTSLPAKVRVTHLEDK